MTEPDTPPRQFRPAAAVLGWLWPGLGHMQLGEVKRGVLIMFGVLLLFFSGILIGGVDVVDHREDGLWFLAQVGCGPVVVAADLVNQHYVKSLPEDRRLEVTSIGRVNEMGTLFVALAGLMNVIVVLDALQFTPRPLPDRRRPNPEAGAEP